MSIADLEKLLNGAVDVLGKVQDEFAEFQALSSSLKRILNWIKQDKEPKVLIEKTDDKGVIVSTNQDDFNLWNARVEMFDIMLESIGETKDSFIESAIKLEGKGGATQVASKTLRKIRINFEEQIALKHKEIVELKENLIKAMFEYHSITIEI